MVDLSGVTFLSAEGKELLKLCLGKGQTFEVHSWMTRFILSQLKNEFNEHHANRKGD